MLRVGRFRVRGFFYFIFVASVAFFSLEFSLRLGSPFLSHAYQAVIREEAYLRTRSNLRLASGSRIILREEAFERNPAILVVGDSFVFGTMVDESDRFGDRLEGWTGRSVLSLGVSGRGPCEFNRILAVALEHLKKAPDVLFYMAFANDFVESFCGEEEKPIYLWDEEYQKHLGSRLRWLREWLFHHSVTYYIAKMLWTERDLVFGDYRPWSYREGTYDFLFAPAYWWKAQVDREIEDVSWSVEMFFQRLDEAKGMIEGRGTELVLILMPFKEQIYVPVLMEGGKVFPDGYHSSFDEAYDYVARRAREKGIAVVDPREIFRSEARKGRKLYWTLDGHLTPEGHALVAGELSVFLLGHNT